MLSMAIKNTILMVLIILIFHFLIKNYMLERMQDMVHPVKRNDALLPASCNDETAEKDETKVAPLPLPKSSAQEHTVIDHNKQKREREDELLKFVFEAGPGPSSARSEKEMIAVVNAPPSDKPSFNVKEYDVMVTGGIGSFEGLKGNDISDSLDSFYSASLAGGQ